MKAASYLQKSFPTCMTFALLYARMVSVKLLLKHLFATLHEGLNFSSAQSMQNGPRGRREREFYEKVRTELRTEKAARLRAAAQTAVSEDISDEDDQASVSGRSDDDAETQAKLPFSVRNAAMLATVPRFCKFLQLRVTRFLLSCHDPQACRPQSGVPSPPLPPSC